MQAFESMVRLLVGGTLLFEQGPTHYRDTPTAAAAGAGTRGQVKPVHHTIIAVDVVGSGSRPDLLILQMRDDLRRVVVGALTKQSIDWNSVDHEDDGDGLQILLGLDHPAIDVVGPFVNELDAALRDHRLRYSDSARLRLRVAFHHGLLYRDADHWTGQTRVLAARLLNSDPIRQALRDNPVINFALIVSEDIHKAVILNERGPDKSAFRHVEVVEKETRTRAWLYTPSVHRQPSGPPPTKPLSRRKLMLTAVACFLAACVVALGVFLGWWLWPGEHVETTGGNAQTWSDYRSGGGTPGPVIAKGSNVRVSCRTLGLEVHSGNRWWYRIASPGWDDRFYASADAFYNNGQTEGPLDGTPFVDESIPMCSG